MDKKILGRVCVLLIILILPLVSCTVLPPDEPSEPNTYYNDYLALSITVPQGWHINAISANLSLQQGQTATPELIEYADGGGRLELLDIQNTAESNSPMHSRFYAYAELFAEPVEIEQYMDLLVSLLQTGDDLHTYSVQKRDELPLARHTAQHIYLQVDTAGQEHAYSEEYYVVPLGAAFVVFYINYWPQNNESSSSALSMLDNITLPAP